MKNQILTFVMLFLLSTLTYAQQRVEQKAFAARENFEVNLNLRYGKHIRVEAWDRNEVSFKTTIEINGGQLNDALLLDYDVSEAGLYISADYDEQRLKEGSLRDCADRGRVFSYSWRDDDNHHVVCSEITYELKVPAGVSLNVESVSADIELVEVSGPVHAKSVSGFVDLSWWEQYGADISMKTISGDAYSDLETLKFQNRKKAPPIVGYELRGTVGGGGPPVHLESVSGDIYLRKH